MIKKAGLILTVIIILLMNCTQVPRKDSNIWVTVEEIALSLGSQPPMNVGFDVDDTVLFSSPGYYYGQQKYSPGSSDYLSMAGFWEEMNNGLDRFSIPKESARQLIELHKRRGDSIYFITARIPTETETVTELLAERFGIENPNKVIFTGMKVLENPKIKPISENNIQIYYGDSDNDIRAAQAVGIRAIRIIRASNSTNKALPRPGSLREEVLVNSDF